jgi:hypothetical protein
MNVRLVFGRGTHEVTTIDIVRRGAVCIVFTARARGSCTHERLPTVIEAILRQADHERQLVASGWHLAGFQPGLATKAGAGSSRVPRTDVPH